MIAEALDAGVVSVAAVGGLIMIVGAGTWWAASMSGTSKSTAKDVQQVLKLQREHGRLLDDHRVEDDARHADQARRLDRLELEADLRGDRTPVRGIPLDARTPTGPHDRLRGDTPKPRRHEDTGDTGSGFDR